VSREYTRILGVHGNVPHGGDIILQDDMEDLLKWTLGATGPDDAALAKAQSYVMSKDYSLNLKTRTTNAAEGDSAVASRLVNLCQGRWLTYEVNFAFESAAAPGEVRFNMLRYDGTYQDYARIVYDHTNSKLRYYTTGGNTIDITDGSMALHTATNHWIRFSADFRSKKYGALWISGLKFDLSALAISSTAAGGANRLVVGIEIITASAAMDQIWFDDLTILARS
jgi:hypothetical protein